MQTHTTKTKDESNTAKQRIRFSRLTPELSRLSPALQKPAFSASWFMSRPTTPTSWTSLLEEAVRTPGLLHHAYHAFHNYSLGNQVSALLQCYERSLEPGPINTYPGWKALGRQVRKGEKALTLCMPVTGKRRAKTHEATASAPETDAATADDTSTYLKFIHRPHWFTIGQTDGDPYQLPPMPAWEKSRALDSLKITELPFAATNGNTQGYAHARTLAINPVAALPHKTLFHECGHIELGHTLDKAFQEGATPRHLQEAEAESVALLLLDTLNLPGTEYSRGYIQHWLKGDTIPERSAQKIFAAADRILKAGQEQLPDKPKG